MNTIEAILTRRSVRKFSDKKVSDEDLHEILSCGMSGPSAVNVRPWSFIVVNDRERLAQLAEAAGANQDIIKNSAFTVLINGDLNRAFKRAPEFWIIDGSIAGQNLILAAWEKGIGSVWLGTWPVESRVENLKKFFELPDEQVPHSLIAFGYPAEDNSGKPHKDYEESQVHFNKW